MLLNLSERINHLEMKKKKDESVWGKRMKEQMTERTNKHSWRRFVAAFIIQNFHVLVSKMKHSISFSFFLLIWFALTHDFREQPWALTTYRWKNVCDLPFRHSIKHGLNLLCSSQAFFYLEKRSKTQRLFVNIRNMDEWKILMPVHDDDDDEPEQR